MPLAGTGTKERYEKEKDRTCAWIWGHLFAGPT